MCGQKCFIAVLSWNDALLPAKENITEKFCCCLVNAFPFPIPDCWGLKAGEVSSSLSSQVLNFVKNTLRKLFFFAVINS